MESKEELCVWVSGVVVARRHLAAGEGRLVRLSGNPRLVPGHGSASNPQGFGTQPAPLPENFDEFAGPPESEEVSYPHLLGVVGRGLPLPPGRLAIAITQPGREGPRSLRLPRDDRGASAAKERRKEARTWLGGQRSVPAGWQATRRERIP